MNRQLTWRVAVNVTVPIEMSQLDVQELVDRVVNQSRCYDPRLGDITDKTHFDVQWCSPIST